MSMSSVMTPVSPKCAPNASPGKMYMLLLCVLGERGGFKNMLDTGVICFIGFLTHTIIITHHYHHTPSPLCTVPITEHSYLAGNVGFAIEFHIGLGAPTPKYAPPLCRLECIFTGTFQLAGGRWVGKWMGKEVGRALQLAIVVNTACSPAMHTPHTLDVGLLIGKMMGRSFNSPIAVKTS